MWVRPLRLGTTRLGGLRQVLNQTEDEHEKGIAKGGIGDRLVWHERNHCYPSFGSG